MTEEVRKIKNQIYGGSLVGLFASSNLFIHLQRYYKRYY